MQCNVFYAMQCVLYAVVGAVVHAMHRMRDTGRAEKLYLFDVCHSGF